MGLDVVHDEVETTLAVAEDAFEGDDRGMPDRSQSHCFAAEKLAHQLIVEHIGPYDLDGDCIVRVDTCGEVDLAHAAAGDDLVDPIGVLDRCADGKISHDLPSDRSGLRGPFRRDRVTARHRTASTTDPPSRW